MKQKKNNLIMLASWTVLVVFMLYYSNISLFQHCHIVNGVTIVHSHFHGESHHNNQTGNHTPSELTLIAHNAQFESLEGSSNMIDFSPPQPLLTLYQSTPQSGHAAASHPYFSLRAPPTV